MRLWPHGGLWRHGDFLKLWSAETVSQFGTQIGQLALPLVAILELDASPFAVAALGTIQFLPFILFTLPAGVWVDRLPRRPILIVGDLGRFVLLATVPIAYVADALTMWQLFVVAFLVGICTVFFDVAYMSYLPSLVERDQIIDGNSKLEISRSAAQVGGPGLAGGLVQVFTAPYAVLVDAISYLGSGLFVLGIRRHEETPARQTVDGSKTSLVTELKEGLRFVLGNPNLRAQAGCTGTSNFFSNVVFAIVLVYLVRDLELSAGGHRNRVLDRKRGLVRRRLLRDATVEALRHGPDHHRRRGARGAVVAADRLRTCRERGDPFPRRRRAHRRVLDRRLQHHPGELPAGDLPTAAPGADELRDALHRLGDHPDRGARRRCSRVLGRSPRDDRHRQHRGRTRDPLDRVLAAAPPPRDARADRGHRPVPEEAAPAPPTAGPEPAGA